MTDPFKKQRYSSSGMSKSASSSQLINSLTPIDENILNKYTYDMYNATSLPINATSGATTQAKYEPIRASAVSTTSENDFYTSDKQKEANEQTNFIQAHIETNKDLIFQLKSNIELLFKATKYIYLILSQ